MLSKIYAAFCGLVVILINPSAPFPQIMAIILLVAGVAIIIVYLHTHSPKKKRRKECNPPPSKYSCDSSKNTNSSSTKIIMVSLFSKVKTYLTGEEGR